MPAYILECTLISMMLGQYFSIAAWLVHCLQESYFFVTTVYDKDHAHFIVGKILGALKEGNVSNHLGLSQSVA